MHIEKMAFIGRFLQVFEKSLEKIKDLCSVLRKSHESDFNMLKNNTTRFFYIGYHFLIVRKSCYPSLRYAS